MKKILIVLILMLPLHLAVYATVPTETFEIKAYRIDPAAYLTVTITDSLSDSLKVIQSGGELDLTNHLEQYMGSTGGADTPISAFDEHIVFSYRVAGNTAGTYRITMTFLPFTNTDSSGTASTIRAAFEVGNSSYVFTSTGNSSVGTSGSIKEDTTSGYGNDPDRTRIVVGNGGTDSDLAKVWTVSDAANEEWIVRGAIGMDISPTDYYSEKTAFGRYESTVTVTLESAV